MTDPGSGARRKIVLPGGSGQVGTVLARWFHGEGHEVVVLGRSPGSAPWRTVAWDGVTQGDWSRELDGADTVINLAGRSVDCRYTLRNRRQILESRVLSTRAVGEAIAAARRPPRVWLQASTATIYAHTYGPPNDEATGTLGPGDPDDVLSGKKGFSVGVAKAWERELDGADTPETRKVALRSALILSPDAGGVFDVLLRLVRFGLGGKVGDGRQYVSWIHDRDFIRAVSWLMEREDISGPVNVAAPEPLPWTDFMQALREAWGIRVGLPASRWLLEIGTLVLRTESELVLKSRRVIPGRLQEEGFAFDFPRWPEASRELVKRWRAGVR